MASAAIHHQGYVRRLDQCSMCKRGGLGGYHKNLLEALRAGGSMLRNNCQGRTVEELRDHISTPFAEWTEADHSVISSTCLQDRWKPFHCSESVYFSDSSIMKSCTSVSTLHACVTIALGTLLNLSVLACLLAHPQCLVANPIIDFETRRRKPRSRLEQHLWPLILRHIHFVLTCLEKGVHVLRNRQDCSHPHAHFTLCVDVGPGS